jgi:hypothetical protein
LRSHHLIEIKEQAIYGGRQARSGRVDVRFGSRKTSTERTAMYCSTAQHGTIPCPTLGTAKPSATRTDGFAFTLALTALVRANTDTQGY